MKKIHYNKLIRDNIPEKIQRAGADFSCRTLTAREYERELIKKVEEEASGMQAARSKKELVEEIADVIDVIEEIKRVKKIKQSSISSARRKNAKEKGSYKKKIFLNWSEDTGYRTNEKRRDKNKSLTTK